MIVRRSLTSYMNETTRRLSDIKEAFERQTLIATSGVRIQDIDDAAGLWRQIDNLDQSKVNLAAYLDNGERAENMLRVADVALDEATDLMSQARGLAVYLSNDSFSNEDRIDQAAEVDQMIEGLIQIGNAQFGDRYVFAGTNYDQPAFEASGAYQGAAARPAAQVSETQFALTGFDGSIAFTPALDALRGFADALRTGERSAVSDQIEVVDDALRGLITARQRVGHEQADVDRINNLTRSLQITVDETLNQLIAEDPFEAVTQFNDLQAAYQVALQVTASRGSSSTLFEFLR